MNNNQMFTICLSKEAVKKTMAMVEEEIKACPNKAESAEYEKILDGLYYGTNEHSEYLKVPMIVIDYIISQYDYIITNN